MDPRSEENLKDVDPRLAAVIRAASQAPQPFEVIQGLRTAAQEALAVASGHSETLHSRHLPHLVTGLAMAVDVGALVKGEVDFTVSNEHGGAYGVIAGQILVAARARGIKLQWGGAAVGAWRDGQTSHFRDWGHFQLDPSEYP